MEYQIRRYRIAAGKLDEFVAAWRTRVVPLRRQFGFTLVGAWALPDTHEFVWILGYEGGEGFAAADSAYYSSAERRRLDPDPARHILGGSEDTAIRVV